jgi:hypothetical protein
MRQTHCIMIGHGMFSFDCLDDRKVRKVKCGTSGVDLSSVHLLPIELPLGEPGHLPAEIFDVFLCHDSEDKPAVREIAGKLSHENVKPWLAADKGSATGMFYLGVLYENGWGVVKDYAKAREWYQKAAAGGYKDANFMLSQLPSK